MSFTNKLFMMLFLGYYLFAIGFIVSVFPAEQAPHQATKQEIHTVRTQAERLRRYSLYQFQTNPSMWTVQGVEKVKAVVGFLDAEIIKLTYYESQAKN